MIVIVLVGSVSSTIAHIDVVCVTLFAVVSGQCHLNTLSVDVVCVMLGVSGK